MSANDDKYPADSGRRRFVKGVVGGASLAAVGVTGGATVNTLTSATGQGGGTTQAMAIENTGGPAPRGMPIIPVEIEDGELKGVWPEVQEVTEQGRTFTVARTDDYEGSGVTYASDWFQYCGIESYEGLQPEADADNFLRSDSSPAYEWQGEDYEEGDALRVDDFDDYTEWSNDIGESGPGKPATGTWRSQDSDDTIPIQVIRSERIEEIANGERDVPGNIQSFVEAACPEGFVAWLNKCTHFCCVPGWKQSDDVNQFGDTDDVYCQCHQSVYDPFSIVETLFVARPRPD